MIGTTFGRWTVVAPAAKRHKNRCVLVRCLCGTEKIASVANLASGRSTSCGCFRRTFLSQTKAKRPFEATYHSLLSTAKHSGRACLISYEQFVEFTKITECFYCEAPINWQPHWRKGTKRSHAYYLDRKDSNREYSVDNCVVACTRCNQSKSNTFTFAEWVEVGKAIKKFREFS